VVVLAVEKRKKGGRLAEWRAGERGEKHKRLTPTLPFLGGGGGIHSWKSLGKKKKKENPDRKFSIFTVGFEKKVMVVE